LPRSYLANNINAHHVVVSQQPEKSHLRDAAKGSFVLADALKPLCRDRVVNVSSGCQSKPYVHVR
jgi:hypothetical protein